MAKPRIFVSSTYYDLNHIRNSLDSFIKQFGYESVLFESGNIPFDHFNALDESCYSEIDSCHMLVLIIGGRYGSLSSEYDDKDDVDSKLKSITKKEYEVARTNDIPIYIFVEKAVLAEYETYKNNKNNDTVNYVHVDSVGGFHLLDDCSAQLNQDTFLKEFCSYSIGDRSPLAV